MARQGEDATDIMLQDISYEIPILVTVNDRLSPRGLICNFIFWGGGLFGTGGLFGIGGLLILEARLTKKKMSPQIEK